MAERFERETPERSEREYVTREGGLEHRERIVHDHGAERRSILYTVTQLIWLFFGILEGLIGLRILLLLIGANQANPFASFIINLTDVFLWPFLGLTGSPGVGNFVLDIPAIIAMFVYALVAWAIVKLVWLLFYRPVATHTIERYDREE